MVQREGWNPNGKLSLCARLSIFNDSKLRLNAYPSPEQRKTIRPRLPGTSEPTSRKLNYCHRGWLSTQQFDTSFINAVRNQNDYKLGAQCLFEYGMLKTHLAAPV